MAQARRREAWERRREERVKNISLAIQRLEESIRRDEETIARLFDRIRNLRTGYSTPITQEIGAKIDSIQRKKTDKHAKINNLWNERLRALNEVFGE